MVTSQHSEWEFASFAQRRRHSKKPRKRWEWKRTTDKESELGAENLSTYAAKYNETLKCFKWIKKFSKNRENNHRHQIKSFVNVMSFGIWDGTAKALLCLMFEFNMMVLVWHCWSIKLNLVLFKLRCGNK